MANNNIVRILRAFFYPGFFLLAMLVVALVSPVSAQTLRTESNKATTRVGNPSVGNDNILRWAGEITNNLQTGSVFGLKNRLATNITNASYNTGTWPSTNTSNLYWCTYLIVDAFNLSGIKGMTKIGHGAVATMHRFWARGPSGYVYVDYDGGAGRNLESLKYVKPGYAIMWERVRRTWTTNGNHVGLVKSINIDQRGNGEIWTYESNSSAVSHKYAVSNYRVGGSAGRPASGFGGALSSGPATPTNAAPTGTTGTGNVTIVLDPGHSGTKAQRIDPATGVLDVDYPNIPEIDEVFDVALKVKQALEAEAYTVIMTKNSARESISHRGRAEVANNANAALAVSIHTDHYAGRWSFAQIYVQRDGLYREKPSGERVYFNNAQVAQKSQAYGQVFAAERGKAEGRPVDITTVNFAGRAGLAAGNIPLVQLFATVPWVYNEVGAGPGELTSAQKEMYAQGIVNSIKKLKADGML